MSLSVGGALRDGASRLFTRAGATLLVAYVATMVVYQLSLNGLLDAVLRRFVSAEAVSGSVAVTYPAPAAVHGAVALVSVVVLSAITVVAVRAFVGGATDRIPREYYTRRLPWATANLLAGGVVFGVVVLVGTLLLVLPGVVAYVGLLFMTMYVAVEDENFVAALRHSWGLVRPAFVPVFALVLVLVVGAGVVGAVVGGVLSLVALSTGLSGWSGVVSVVVTAPLSVFVLAVLSAAFDRLRGTGSDPPTDADARGAPSTATDL